MEELILVFFSFYRLASEVPYPTLAIGFASGVVAFVALICAMIYNAQKG